MSEARALSDRRVVECAPPFSEDEEAGFENTTLHLPEEDDGPLAATLIRMMGAESDSRPAVLYVHGFVDYFFQKHLADAYEAAGFRFYALDLRRHGRSIRPGNRPCMAWDVADFFEELDWATEFIQQRHPALAAIVAHSTGGLISSIYLASRQETPRANRLVLNSPFLELPVDSFEMAKSWLAARVARFAPHLGAPASLSGVYGKVLHKNYGGEWDYDLEKKPLEGFPFYVGWFRMIRSAQAQIKKGLDLDLPILSLHSDKSRKAGQEPTDEDRVADGVLRIADIKRLSPRLGSQVTLVEITDGLHDLTLSRKPVRERALSEMVNFVRQEL